MTLEANDKAGRQGAFCNVVGALKLDRSLPENVFSGEWSDFLFFESDRIFAPGFAEVVGELLGSENAGVCCLLNLNQTRSLKFEEASAIFLDRMTTASEYAAQLRRGGPAVGWLYSMDKYGCASDVGDWSIYCEKQNDIAVIALRSSHGIKKFSSPLRKVWAESIETLNKRGAAAVIPFSKLTEEWRTALTANYRKRCE